jgi:spore coat polysaccharide biosynthesis predicted glycosyltransferase SpsG
VDKDLLKMIENKKINILIVDQPRMDTDFHVHKAAKPKLLIVGLDYFDYSNKNIDIIINLFNQNLEVPNTKKIVQKNYQGPKYAIIRDSFLNYVKRKKIIRRRVKNVLIAFGSADPSSNTMKILNLLEKLKTQFKVEVVIGPLFKRREELIEKIKRLNGVAHLNVIDLEKLIFNADLGFSGAGTTLLEFCALRTPVIIFTQNENERRFAEYFEERKAVKLLRENLSDEDKISEIQKIIASQRIRKTMSENQKKLVDLDGKKRIKKIILKEYLSVKK